MLLVWLRQLVRCWLLVLLLLSFWLKPICLKLLLQRLPLLCRLRLCRLPLCRLLLCHLQQSIISQHLQLHRLLLPLLIWCCRIHVAALDSMECVSCPACCCCCRCRSTSRLLVMTPLAPCCPRSLPLLCIARRLLLPQPLLVPF